MQLVTDPASVVMDPDNMPWTERLHYTEVAHLLSDYQQSNAIIGRRHCPVCDYLMEHVNDPVDEVEAYIYSHPDWGPPTICESMIRTLVFNNAQTEHGEFLAGWAQHYLMLQLIKNHPFSRGRSSFCAMLTHPDMRFVTPRAAYVALAYLNEGHSNPGEYFRRHPEVARHFPDVDLTSFAAPDFPSQT